MRLFVSPLSPLTRALCCSLLLALALGVPQPVAAQLLDRIVAVVDDEIILESEIQAQMAYLEANEVEDDGTLPCQVFEELLMNRMLLAKARLDSVEVNEDQVERELNQRIGYMVQQVGSVENLEKINKMSLVEFKQEMRPKIREQLMIQREKQTIYQEVNITPQDVKQFYNNLPKDSLPYLPAEVEISHILLKPEPNEETKQEAREKLAEIRNDIVKGFNTFEEMARVHSDDPGSARQDGNLGEFGRGEMLPAFEEVAYSLDTNQISEVFESAFGYHIIRLEDKIGDRVNASHILIRPRVSREDEERVKKRLSEIRELILADSLSFAQAASEFSQDERSQDNAGMLMNPETGDPRLALDQLDADTYFKVDAMEVGEITEPLEVISQQGGPPQRNFHILYLRKRHAPHQATLKTDYAKFQEATRQSRQAELLDAWFERARDQIYVEIKDHPCAQALQAWYKPVAE